MPLLVGSERGDARLNANQKGAGRAKVARGFEAPSAQLSPAARKWRKPAILFVVHISPKRTTFVSCCGRMSRDGGRGKGEIVRLQQTRELEAMRGVLQLDDGFSIGALCWWRCEGRSREEGGMRGEKHASISPLKRATSSRFVEGRKEEWKGWKEPRARAGRWEKREGRDGGGGGCAKSRFGGGTSIGGMWRGTLVANMACKQRAANELDAGASESAAAAAAVCVAGRVAIAGRGGVRADAGVMRARCGHGVGTVWACASAVWAWCGRCVGAVCWQEARWDLIGEKAARLHGNRRLVRRKGGGQ
ncbi:hypothetical protein C8R46DRAFT_1040649 [Mycena filopes]|nr:hypothetical protein C8R46DRAFT_1040649 [Mycena filopes]